MHAIVGVKYDVNYYIFPKTDFFYNHDDIFLNVFSYLNLYLIFGNYSDNISINRDTSKLS